MLCCRRKYHLSSIYKQASTTRKRNGKTRKEDISKEIWKHKWALLQSNEDTHMYVRKKQMEFRPLLLQETACGYLQVWKTFLDNFWNKSVIQENENSKALSSEFQTDHEFQGITVVLSQGHFIKGHNAVVFWVRICRVGSVLMFTTSGNLASKLNVSIKLQYLIN